MEGLVPTNRVGQFKDQLKERCVYTIDRFDLYDPRKSYRSVDNPLRIAFTMRTILTEVIPPPENFPMFAYTALPFSMLSDRVDENIVLSDIVGLVNKVTPILPPSGKAKSHKRQVYITDGSEHAIVTLWGEQADLFDTDALMRASNEEPVIVLFVGMTVGQYSGLLAFKSTSVTRWYVNAPIPEIADVRERSKHLPWRIEWHNGNQNHNEPTASSITEITAFEPNDIMGERYKLSVRITEIHTEKGWYYMSCTECWKKVTLEDGDYKCPRCPTTKPLPRYRFIARAADTASTDSEDAKFADLYLFGPRGEIVVGKEALTLLSSLRGEANAIPQDLLAIIGKEFSTVVTPRRESLDLLHPHQIAEPILRTNVAVRQGLNDSPAGQVCKDLHTTEATEQVEVTARESTPLSSTNLAPQHLPSPSSTTDEVPPGSPARGKHRATSADKNPKAKKELRFSKDA